LAPLLVQALGTPNTTVNVKDGVELDLTPYLAGPISIKEGVQLLGERIARPGTPYQPGPLLFVTPNPVEWNPSNWPNPLFRIEGDNVRFSGVRLQGPGSPPDAWRAKIPRPQCPDSSDGCALGFTRAMYVGDENLRLHPINVEIDHNEFSNWNTSAVDMRCDGLVPDAQNPNPPPCPDRDHRDSNDRGRIWVNFTSKVSSDPSGITYPSVSEPIYVRDNYFHDNACYCETYFGYGVSVGGSHALIERNVFDGHHHAIAGDNDHLTGYRAYRNLVLGNSYRYNQQFDVHGDRWCNNGSTLDNAAECGLAGHDVDIRWNSFLSTNFGFYGPAPSIKVRGTPSLVWEFGQPVGAVVKSNVFPYRNLDDAVKMNGGGSLIGHGKPYWDQLAADDNRLDWLSALAAYGSLSDACDFDGDGKPDRLFTTGQTWWFQSLDTSKGPTPWVYLTTSTLLVTDVVLVPSKSGECDIYLR
jgi:hypothetical protein